MKGMMIDYRVSIQVDDDEPETKYVRKPIDNYEFCVREDMAYFVSDGVKLQVPLQDISQVYTY